MKLKILIFIAAALVVTNALTAYWLHQSQSECQQLREELKDYWKEDIERERKI